ncbi:MAG: diguanylate cyclase, partial [Solirubrobacterales bacterium]|nr:diguanylate cyclase [Solirubrobacterales bacterium]
METLRQDKPSAALLDTGRLAELQATGLMDAGAQPALERFTRLACAMINAPVAVVSLVDDHRQYFAAMQGMTGWAADARGTPLSHSFCQHVVSDGVLDVPDALEHPVLRHNLAVPELGVRAYLGIPLVTQSGKRMGALCTIDGEARTWTAEERAVLEDLAAAASTDLQLRLAASANAHQARHDALTGLANRRQLDSDLGAALVNGIGRSLLALLDLDGFKSYNDAFGHPAGDELLRRIAGRLREHADLAGGTAYRMGGDEFCLLVPETTDVGEIAEMIAERTGPYDITASFGVVGLGSEVTTAVEALQLVDERLYSRKYGRAGGSSEHACSALLQALAERHPTLGRHAEAVSELASATARQLGLEDCQITDVRLTARLHDVGKVAVPDSILDKPGPLDDDEWAFIHRHTVVGQRILAATPALTHVAAVVRSTHERWDGAGYPDGLKGAEIPLVARIVFAADAYDAMTSDRSYRAAMEPDEAKDELRR